MVNIKIISAVRGEEVLVLAGWPAIYSSGSSLVACCWSRLHFNSAVAAVGLGLGDPPSLVVCWYWNHCLAVCWSPAPHMGGHAAHAARDW